MRIRDKTLFSMDLLLLSVFVAFFFAPGKPQVEWYALGVISVAVLHSYWQAFFRTPKPWKHYLSRGIIAAFLGLVSIAVGVSDTRMIAFVTLAFGVACIDLVFWLRHRNDPITP